MTQKNSFRILLALVLLSGLILGCTSLELEPGDDGAEVENYSDPALEQQEQEMYDVTMQEGEHTEKGGW